MTWNYGLGKFLSVGLFALSYLFCGPVRAQMPAVVTSHPLGGAVTVTGGWTWDQGTSGTEGAGTWTEQTNACGAAFSNQCTIQLPGTTLAGSDMVVGSLTGNSITVTSAYSCSGSPPCSSGNHIDVFTLCPSGSCASTVSGFDNGDLAYVAGGAGGANFITMNISGTPTGFQFQEFGEIQPPNCNGTPCPTSVDNGGNGSTAGFNGTCGPCTGPAFTLTGTDGIIEIVDSGAVISSPSAAYPIDWIGNFFSFDNQSGAAVTFNTNSSFSLRGLSFKTNQGLYSPPTKPFSMLFLGPPANYTAQATCSPACTAITLPTALTATGKLIAVFAQSVPGSTQATIASITDNQSETWTVPTGANTCKQTGGTIDLSCAYVVTTTASSVSTFTATASASTTMYFMFFEIGASTGTIAAGNQNSSHTTTTSAVILGQAPTITSGTSGAVNVCFDELGWAGSGTSPVEVGSTLYMQPQGANFFGQFTGNTANGATLVSLNERRTTVPQALLSATVTSQESSYICFHN